MANPKTSRYGAGAAAVATRSVRGSVNQRFRPPASAQASALQRQREFTIGPDFDWSKVGDDFKKQYAEAFAKQIAQQTGRDPRKDYYDPITGKLTKSKWNEKYNSFMGGTGASGGGMTGIGGPTKRG